MTATSARGGRPTAAAAALLGDAILDVATDGFLRDGYAATSIETVARRAHVAKRTLYARFRDKDGLFRAVLERLMAHWLATPAPAPPGADLADALVALAERILAVALQPDALALHRLLISEGGRLPQIAGMLQEAGTGTGVALVADLLARTLPPGRPPAALALAAEQFMHLVVTGPQRRALGLGRPLERADLAAWARSSVTLFLHGWMERPAGDRCERPARPL